jgi:chloramphenicol O-acetyltransferase
MSNLGDSAETMVMYWTRVNRDHTTTDDEGNTVNVLETSLPDGIHSQLARYIHEVESYMSEEVDTSAIESEINDLESCVEEALSQLEEARGAIYNVQSNLN